MSQTIFIKKMFYILYYFYTYTFIAKFEVGKSYWFINLLITKAAFIWSKMQ